MDTKLKKSNKLAKMIITLCVILPAVFLVSLYPTIEKAMLDKSAYYQEQNGEQQKEIGDWVITDNMIHYALESCYVLYAELYNSVSEEPLNYGVLNEYGWSDDCAVLRNSATYIATYTYEGEEGEVSVGTSNADVLDDSIARITLVFDSYGNITGIDVIENQAVYLWDDALFSGAKASMQQFSGNVKGYNSMTGKNLTAEDYVPKNFTLEIGFYQRCQFVDPYEVWFGNDFRTHDEENLCFEVGAYYIVLALVISVALIACILPLFRRLNTGKEKVFSFPLELTLIFTGVGVAGGIGMCCLMAHSTMIEIETLISNGGGISLLGTEVTADTIYCIVLGLSIILWSILFFIEYAVISNLRQMLSNPKYYLNNQILIVRLILWIKGKIKKVWDEIGKIDLANDLKKNILKIVIGNFVISTLFCCLWLFGVIGLVIYSAVLYIMAKRYIVKVQCQYRNVLESTQKMAEGDLKIVLEEELGPFQTLGASLGDLQQGFEKAVIAEAKSQSMKSELITNVSHDLKTPLTAIITYVDLLKKEDISEEERKSYIDTLDRKSQRLKSLVEDLFEVSKAQSGNVTLNLNEIDVVSLVKQVKSEMSEQILESSLDFRWNLPEEKIMLMLDGQKTYRVFENLINNAIKYSMPFSRVYVELLQKESDVQITFKNMSAQELNFEPQRLTERFVRGDKSRNTEGNGLGLAIAKSFVELQKGMFRIEVDGDLFKVTIVWNK